jgi:hypothetical protein
MLKEIIGTVGPRTFVDPPFRVDYGCNISLGADFYSIQAGFSISIRFLDWLLMSIMQYADSGLWNCNYRR